MKFFINIVFTIMLLFILLINILAYLYDIDLGLSFTCVEMEIILAYLIFRILTEVL